MLELQSNRNAWLGKSVHWVGNSLFFFLLLILMLDPGNAILRMKDVAFVLFVGFNILFYKPDFKYLLLIVPVFMVIFASYLLSTIQQNTIDYTYFTAAIKGFSPLVLLMWIKHYNVLKLSIAPVIITCLVILVLYSFVVSYEELEAALFLYSKEHNEMVMLTSRNWLGFKIFGMYYRSIVSFMPILFYLLYQSLTQRPIKLRYLIGLLVVCLSFWVSGTRAMFLTPFAIIGIAVYLLYLSDSKYNKYRYLFYPFFAILFLLFVMVIFMMATQEGDVSNDIKYNHLISYTELFDQNLEYLFLGQGPGSMFYSKGFGRMTAETEWTYLEVIRCYGVFSVIILFVYLFPLYCCLKQKNNNLIKGMALTYLVFLLVGGTNPFLLNSQGMTMLWIMYSFIERNNAFPTFQGIKKIFSRRLKGNIMTSNG